MMSMTIMKMMKTMRTDEVVLDSEELDLLLPSVLSDAFSAHGTVSWVLDVRLARILDIEHLHRALGHQLLRLLPLERVQQFNVRQKSARVYMYEKVSLQKYAMRWWAKGRHAPVVGSRYRRPLGVLFALPLYTTALHLYFLYIAHRDGGEESGAPILSLPVLSNYLARSKLGDEDVIMDRAWRIIGKPFLLISHRIPLEVSREYWR